MFVNSNPYLDFPKPSLAKVIPIGGISADPTLIDELSEVTNCFENLFRRKESLFSRIK